MHGRLQVVLTACAQRIMDQDIRVRWLRGPWGKPLADLVGPIQIPEMTLPVGMGSEEQTRLLELIVEGKTNGEIAEALGVTEDKVSLQLSELFARIGASSRADATAFALIGRMV
jgi:DNA-binding NarL/FixJ family response regulator